MTLRPESPPRRIARGGLVPAGIAITVVLAGLISTDTAFGQQQNQTPSCSTEDYRQFDFWVGDWEVTNPAGTVVGTNRITSILGGCVLMEAWTGARQSRGKSWNIYNAATGQWHQSWVDNQGLLLQLDGTFENGSMVLEGSLPGKDGKPTRQRIAWTPQDDGSVRQVWTTSKDDGETWTTAFDGMYRKKN